MSKISLKLVPTFGNHYDKELCRHGQNSWPISADSCRKRSTGGNFHARYHQQLSVEIGQPLALRIQHKSALKDLRVPFELFLEVNATKLQAQFAEDEKVSTKLPEIFGRSKTGNPA